MTVYAVLDGTEVKCFVALPESEAPEGAVPMPDMPTPHYPPPPYAGARLHWVDGELVWQDSRPLAEARAAAWEAIKAHRTAISTAPYPLRDFELDADELSIDRITRAVVLMSAMGLPEQPWRCADNAMRTLTLADLLAVGAGIGARLTAAIETSDGLWQQLQAAQTHAEVAAVEWPA